MNSEQAVAWVIEQLDNNGVDYIHRWTNEHETTKLLKQLRSEAEE